MEHLAGETSTVVRLKEHQCFFESGSKGSKGSKGKVYQLEDDLNTSSAPSSLKDSGLNTGTCTGILDYRRSSKICSW